jgi:hypothetical protein
MIETKEKLEKKFPAVVAVIVNPYRVVINRGAEHDVKLGQRFLVYTLSEEEILDPITNESLGHLEIVKGTGKVIHVQEKMSTIESDQTEMSNKTITKKNHRYLPIFPEEAVVEEIASPNRVPFDSVKVGDKVKPI